MIRWQFPWSGRAGTFRPQLETLEERTAASSLTGVFIAGKSDAGLVATITEGDDDLDAPEDIPYTVQIEWGDGTTSGGRAVSHTDGSQSLDVFGTHFYQVQGTYFASITVIEGSEGDSFTSSATIRVLARPHSAQGLVELLQELFPAAHIRITSAQRGVEDQAGLMLEQALNNPAGFLRTYKGADYAQEMVAYLSAPSSPNGPSRAQVMTDATNPGADVAGLAAVLVFSSLIEQARARGRTVSAHLTNQARDITVPRTNQTEIAGLIRELGGTLITNEPGHRPHWHISYIGG
jgi:hypothetical protein